MLTVNLLLSDVDVPSSATSLNLVKSLLLQLLEQSVGNIDLYKSLVNVFKKSAKFGNAAEVESALWVALDTAFAKTNNLVVVVDGLDEVNGGDATAIELFGRLHELTAKHGAVRTITLSRPLGKPLPNHTREFQIDASHTREDMRHFILESLTHYHHYHDQSHEERERIVEQIIRNANGSFLWADLTLESLKKEQSHSGFTNSLNKAPISLADTIQKILLSLDPTKSETRLILSWLITAVRPLSVAELESLLEIDVSGTIKVSRATNIRADIHHSCGSLVSVRDGLVRFRHASIRQHLLDLSKYGKTLVPYQDAQLDITTRILAYAKLNLIRHHKASIQPLEPSIIKELFQTHSLLEYTIRYWTAHFRSSSLFQTNGSYTFSPEFKSAFPNSTLMALIEASCWEPQTSTVEAVRMHILALQIRQHALKEICEPVLQCYITIALTYDRLSDPKEASRYYYQAIHLSRTITSKYSSIAIFCATSYLTCTQALTTNTRTDVTTHREETLKFIIETQQHQHGTVNEATIKYKTLLAELYVQIKEIQSAMSLYREVYDSSVELYGASSREVVGISEAVSGVQQQETVKGEEIQSLSSIFEIAEQTMSITDIRRINISILMAEMHESHKQLIQAEEIYVTLWRRISEECRLRSSVESHEKKLEVTLRYVKFLLKHHRHAEAESILRGVWTEYEHESLTSEVMVLRLKQVGQLLKDMGIFAVALSIFSSVWSYFKRTKKETSSEARSSAILLIETFEIVEVTEELCIDTSIYESVLSDVIETSISSSTIKKIDITTVRSCEVISIYYTRREMWAAALKVCDNHLHVMWPSLRSGHIKELPKEFRQESINIAMRLAYCELREGHVETAEQLYRHIFQETRSTPHVHIDLIDETGKALASFYEESKQHDKVIAVYKELLEEYRKHHGHTHHHSIEILYLLGDLCMKYNHKDADRYYLEIVTALNKSSEVCHIDAVRAASLLSKYYYEHKRWTELHRICSTLWITITKRGKEYKMSSELVETIYQRYSYVLEKEIKVEYSVLRQITIEYRETCVKLFGAHAEITIKATLRLAEICESNTKYQQEAIKIYEEVSRTTTTEKNASIIGILMIAKQRLAGLYIKSNTNTQGALTLYQESYEHARNRHGCSHKSTLSKLGEFVMVCKERNDQQWALTATRTLQSSTIEVISVEKNSEKLFEAAVSIATAYLTCGYREQGFELLRELRRQIIFKDMRSSEKFGFKIDQSVERRAYVFLIAFDETLKGNKKISFSEVMADLLTETFLYENYNRSLKQDSSFDKTIVHGSRLHSFLTAKQRQDQITLYEDQLHELFLKNMGTSFKVSRHATRVFIVILLQHLGETKTHVELDNAACVAGNDRVLSLLEQSKFQEAYELAICVYYFVIHQHNGYAQGQNLINGFKLSLYMAGRGTKRCPDQALRSQMMDLSKTILHKIMQSARHTKFGFVKRDPVELNELAGLMGEQQNWDDLEVRLYIDCLNFANRILQWLLTELWGSRHTQNTWSAATIVWIGRRLVEIRFSHKERRHSAIHLCEDICYNMRRVWGPLDRTTIEMYNLLSRLYTTEKRFTDAMVIHEEILRHELDSEEELGKDDAATSRKQLELLKRSYQRNGGWDKDPKIYSELYRQLSQVFEHERDWQGVQSVERWNAKAPTDSEGTFTTPTSWEFMDAAEEKVKRRNLLGCIGENGHCGDEELEDILIAPSKAETKKSPVYQNGHGMKV